MNSPHLDKAALRQQLRDARRRCGDKDELSRQIVSHIERLPEWPHISTVMVYSELRHEVRLRFWLPTLWNAGLRVVTTWCDGPELRPVELQSLDELAPGSFGLTEPAQSVRDDPERIVPLEAIDLALIPGVGFDRRGHRLGHGVGHYDRLLAEAPPKMLRVGVAFACQIVDLLPTEPHDVPMHRVITQHGTLQLAGS